MDTINEWISPTINFAVLFLCGALGGVGGMYSAGKAITFFAVGDAVFRGGAFGSAAGLVAMEKLARPFAMAVAVFVGGGWLGKDEIVAWLLRVLKPAEKDRDERAPPQP